MLSFDVIECRDQIAEHRLNGNKKGQERCYVKMLRAGQVLQKDDCLPNQIEGARLAAESLLGLANMLLENVECFTARNHARKYLTTAYKAYKSIGFCRSMGRVVEGMARIAEAEGDELATEAYNHLAQDLLARRIKGRNPLTQ